MTIASGEFVVDGRYEVGDVLGRGGMGEVRRARDRRLQRDVAIKFLRPDLAAQPVARERFEHEAKSAARLSHPNVVLVFDSGEHDGRPYLVMECLPGEALSDELQRGPLTAARATWVARDVLAALAAAHEIGLVHRDVSPSNILLTDTGRAKLADFGIAKAAETASVTTVGFVVGTPGYLPPERMRGEPATDASDVYSLGVTLRKATEGAAIDDELAQLLDRMTAEDPAQRPTAVEALAALAGAEEIESAETELATMAVPLVSDPLMSTGPETVTIAATPAVTEAAPVVTVPASLWRSRGLQMTTVAIAVLVGAILLIATNYDSAGSPVVADDTPETTVTTQRTFTTVAPTTAVTEPSLRVIIGGDGEGDEGKPDKGDGKAKGREKDDD